MSFDYPYQLLKPDFEKINVLVKDMNLPPLIARVLVNRGIFEIDDVNLFLNGSLKNLHNPMDMGDLSKAIDIILKHIDQGWRILIHGDYDADGVTSTAIMVKALGRLGAKVEHHIPDRFEEGYGFSEDAVKSAADSGIKLIVTVDCGSSNHEIVEFAHKEGVQVIITDHHEVSNGPPPADAFVNLKKDGETYPFRALSGAGVAFKLVQGIYTKLGRDDWADFADLATVGTVADVVPLKGENRLIVKEGIKYLSQRKHVGITQLLEVTNVNREVLSPWDISFIIAPKINAAGRLADANVALDFLLEDDPLKARELAEQLCKLNERRQQIENVIKEDIENLINENPEMLTEPVWVLGSRNWHQGVIGIVASRFSQSFKRPVFLISVDEDGVGRGSARCEENYDVYSALTLSKDLLVHFGGHRLAGGFNILEENINKFRERVNNPQLFSHVYRPPQVDMELCSSKISLELAKELEILAPFGEGNPKPLFLTRNLKIQSMALVGNKKQHLRLWVSTSAGDVKGIAFGKGPLKDDIWNKDLYYDLLYNLDVDNWSLKEEASLKVQEIVPPDKDCLRIITGLEEVAIKPINEDEKDKRWVLVDARRVINRRKYIRNLSKAQKKTLVLTRNRRQMEVLNENLKKERVRGVEVVNLKKFAFKGKKNIINNNALIYISPYDKFQGDVPIEEIVLYHPPYLWNHFKPELFKMDSLKRVHLLFNEADLKREELNQEILSPDRKRLLKIYNYLRRHAPSGNYKRIQPSQIVLALRNEFIHVMTIKIALRIFKEIKLIDYKEDEKGISVCLVKSPKKDLEDSQAYKTQLQKKQIFFNLKELYLRPFLKEFSDSVREVVRNQ